MKITKFFKNKKAFSAVIASLILMLLAVAAGAVVYAYVMGWIGGVQTNPTGQGIIVIDSISADVSENKTVIYVRNVGSISVNITAVYVDGVSPTSTEWTASPDLLEPGAIETVEIVFIDNTSIILEKGTSYLVKVSCTDGTTTSQTVIAKQ